MKSEEFADSPVRLRPLSSGVFEARSGGKTVKVDLERKPPKPPGKEEEEEIVRTGNHGPTVGALLMRGDAVVARHVGDPITLRPSGVEELSSWIESQGSADKLVVEAHADHVTTDQVRRLAAVGSRHRLIVDVNLGSDG